jgi:hypothetical protein
MWASLSYRWEIKFSYCRKYFASHKVPVVVHRVRVCGFGAEAAVDGQTIK